MNLISQLSKKAFWDVDMRTMDAEQHADYIIQKVFEYGGLQDMLVTYRYYGLKKVKEVLLDYEFFLPDSANFAAAIFDIEIGKLKCFSHKPFRQSVTR